MKTFANCVLALAMCLFVFHSSSAHAGSRELEVLFVNMTPDAESGGESKTCVEAIKRQFRKADTTVKKLGESKIRKAVGVAKGGAAFVTWKPKLFKKLIYPVSNSDVIVLVDCRPEKELLDILLVPVRLRPLAISYRSVPNPKLLNALTKRLLAHAWDGFSP